MKRLAMILAGLLALFAVLSLFPATSLAEGLYTVSFNSMGGSEVESVQAEENALITTPETPSKAGSKFGGWYKEEACQNKWNFEEDRVTGDVTLYAKWTETTYTVTAVSVNEAYGKVSGGGAYRTGETVTLAATPSDGYRFIRWVEANLSSSVYSFVANGDMTATAEFAPIERTALTAQSVRFDSVALAWTAVPEAAGYEILRAKSADGPFEKLTQTGPDVLGYTDAGLAVNTAYFYKVRAFCVTETAMTYAAECANASASPVLPVASPVAASCGYGSLYVAWNAIDGASGYEVYRSGSPDGAYSKVFTANASQLGYVNTGLTANATYYYKLRSYAVVNGALVFSDYSYAAPAAAVFAAPSLTAVSASHKSINLLWNRLEGVNGYMVYRATTINGRYSKIYTTSSRYSYTDSRVTEGRTYFYKVQAYRGSGRKRVYSPYSAVQSVVPVGKTLMVDGFTLFYQGDSRWRFSSSVKNKACLLTAYAITINNMGITVTPRTVYEGNGSRTSISMSRLQSAFGIRAVCALASDSPYLASFDGHKTYVKESYANAVAAIKAALDRNPEGVILYFKKGSRSHAVVACKYSGNTIYYSDPGRSKNKLLTFSETWVSYHHRMTYAHLAEMVALDRS